MSGSAGKKRAEPAMSPEASDIYRAQQALEEIFASKPEGYDASRNAASARMQIDCHQQCSELIRNGTPMDESMVMQLEGAMQDMANHSPAAKSIITEIDEELAQQFFATPSDRMKTKMLKLRLKMVGNAQVEEEARRRFGASQHPMNAAAKVLEEQVINDCSHAFKETSAQKLARRIALDENRVTSRELISEDGCEYESFNGARFGDPDTQSFRLVAEDKSTGEDHTFAICVPNYLLPSLESGHEGSSRGEVMAELSRQNDLDRKKKEEHKTRLQDALKERVSTLMASVLVCRRPPTTEEGDAFEKLAAGMAKADIPSNDVCSLRRRFYAFDTTTPIELDHMGRTATEAAQHFIDQEPDTEKRARMQADIDNGRIQLVAIGNGYEISRKDDSELSESERASKLAGLWDNAINERCAEERTPADFKEAMERMPEAQKAAFMKIVEEITAPGGDGVVTDEHIQKMKDVAVGMSNLPAHITDAFPITDELAAQCKANMNSALDRLMKGEDVDTVVPPPELDPDDRADDHTIMCRFAETVRFKGQTEKSSTHHQNDCMEVIMAFDRLCESGGKDGELFKVLRKHANGSCLDRFGGMPIYGVTPPEEERARIAYRAESMAVAYDQAMKEKEKAKAKPRDSYGLDDLVTMSKMLLDDADFQPNEAQVNDFLGAFGRIGCDKKQSMCSLFSTILKKVEKENKEVARKAFKGKHAFRVQYARLIAQHLRIAMKDIEDKAVSANPKRAETHPTIGRINAWLDEYPQYRGLMRETCSEMHRDGESARIADLITKMANGMPEDHARSLFQACGGDLLPRDGPIPDKFKGVKVKRQVAVTPSTKHGGMNPEDLLASMPKGGGTCTIFNSSGEHVYDFTDADKWTDAERMNAASEVCTTMKSSIEEAIAARPEQPTEELTEEQEIKKRYAEEFVKNASREDMNELIRRSGMKMKLVPDPTCGTVAEHEAACGKDIGIVDHFDRLGLSKDRPIVSRGADGSKRVIPHPLTEGEKARIVISEAQGESAWNEAVKAIRDAREGLYPPDWHAEVLEKGLWKKLNAKPTRSESAKTTFEGLKGGFFKSNAAGKAKAPPSKPSRRPVETSDSDATEEEDDEADRDALDFLTNTSREDFTRFAAGYGLATESAMKELGIDNDKLDPLEITKNPDGTYSSGRPARTRGMEVMEVSDKGITRCVENGMHPGWAEHLPPVQDMVDENGKTWPDWMSYVPRKYHGLVGVDDRKLRDIALKHVPKEHPFHSKWGNSTNPVKVALMAFGSYVEEELREIINSKIKMPKVRWSQLLDCGFEPITMDGKSCFHATHDTADTGSFTEPDAIRCMEVKEFILTLDSSKYRPKIPKDREFLERCMIAGANIEDTYIERTKRFYEDERLRRELEAVTAEKIRLGIENEENEREAREAFKHSAVYKEEQRVRNQKARAKEKANLAFKKEDAERKEKERLEKAAADKLAKQQADADHCIDNGIKYGQQLWDEGKRKEARERLGIANKKHSVNASAAARERSKAKREEWEQLERNERDAERASAPPSLAALTVISNDTPDILPKSSPLVSEASEASGSSDPPRESQSQRKARRKREKAEAERQAQEDAAREAQRLEEVRLAREKAEAEEKRQARLHAEEQRMKAEQEKILAQIEARNASNTSSQAAAAAGKGGRGGRGGSRRGRGEYIQKAVKLVPAASAAGPSTAPAKPADEEDMCIICFDQARTHTTVPCGHLKFCGDCAAKMTKQGREHCPECNHKLNPAQKFMKVFG